MSESRALFVLANENVRYKVVESVWCAEPGSRVEIKGPKRTLDQNSRLWATLTDIAEQVRWHGMLLSTNDWKEIFLSALKRELRMVPTIDGTGFVQLGRSSSDLSKGEMADLITLIEAFGAERGVVFHDQRKSEMVG